jgi:cysteinyl-tRNA synthetase
MSMKYLGDRFDVHTGGADLKFPHHEDERAQSDAGTGHEVVSIWVYGGFLQFSGQKMAKSKGNITRVTEIAEQGVDPLAFRLLCFGTRYRSEMDFSWRALEAEQRRLVRLRQRMADWKDAERGARSPAAADLDRRFREAVADDLDLPTAIKVMGEAVSGDLSDGERYDLLASWDAVLGLDLERLAREGFEVPGDVQALIDQRDEARGARDFATSDRLRDRLSEMGWEVMDTADGTRVRPLAGRP